MRVYVVPLAAKGFVPVDPTSNPVRYALEDEDGRLVSQRTYATAREAEAAATAQSFELER